MEQRQDRSAPHPRRRSPALEQIIAGTCTRRAFVIQTARKAAWITPVVVSLAAQPAFGGLSNPSGGASGAECVEVNEVCTMDSDCCSNDCSFGVCQ
jgi:hypothetical protein